MKTHIHNASMCGIFGYINYLVEKDRRFIIDTLVNGMHELCKSSVSLCTAADTRSL